MQQSPLNIVVFDEEQSFRTEQSRPNMNRHASQDVLGQSNLIYNEIALLGQKIQHLEQQSNQLQEGIKAKSDTNISQTTQATHNSSQVEELLKLIEKKIKIIVKETKVMIEKLSTDIEKKLSQAMKEKNHEANTITKIQNHCRETILQIQSKYEKDLERVRGQHQLVESQMMKRVEEIQQKFREKLTQQKLKQEDYLHKIENLEEKLKNSQKNKKLIEVTQERPTSLTNNVLENISGMSNTPPIGRLPPQDTSKRRPRIFEGKNSNRSVSPNNQILSPAIKAPPHQTQSLARPVTQPSQETKAIFHSKHAEQKKFQKCQSLEENEEFVQRKLVTESSKLPSKKFSEKEENQFYRDIPKANWEKFQDYDEGESSGSQEDVFFYPEHTKQQKSEPKIVFEYVNPGEKHEQKMFSPFDVN